LLLLWLQPLVLWGVVTGQHRATQRHEPVAGHHGRS
jgi:hypothetical protein